MRDLFSDGRKRHGHSIKRQKAMVLVVTLAIVVLLTVAVLAFFTHTMAERQIESSRTNRTESNLLLKSAQDYVVGTFLGEVTSQARSQISSSNGVSLYFPLSPTNIMVERRIGPNISMASTNFLSLVRQSDSSCDTNASTQNSSDPARNGRMKSPASWNFPQLLSGGGFTQTNQLPSWIYVTQSGDVTNSPSTNVIGRFAYNVYNIGGLIDISVAGVPGSVTNISAFKANDVGCDLTQLPGVSQSAVNDLVAFRTHLNSPSDSAYAGMVSAMRAKGFLALTTTATANLPSATNQAFFTRQDLLRYVRRQNPTLTDALPYLTHFSRTLNAPSWTPPASPASSNPKIADIRYNVAGTVNHYADTGGVETYIVSAGSPLVQRKFSLAKIAWLTCKGPSASLASSDVYYNPGGTPGAIKACFGLQWNQTEERWDYVGATGSTLRDSIATLNSVAAEPAPREPDFFELLKAGILDSTLGGAALGKTTPAKLFMSACPVASNAVDGSTDLHLLRIGANIIDCADADNFPTRIALQFGSVVIERAGVEDLPYFYCLNTCNLRLMDKLSDSEQQATGKTHNVTKSDFVWVPELFNPNSASNTSDGPASLQIDLSSGSVLQIGYATNGNSLNLAPPNLPKSMALPPITISGTSLAIFRSGPSPVRDSTAGNRLGLTVPYVDDSVKDIAAFQIFSYEGETGLLPVEIQADSKVGAAQVQNVMMRLQYKTPSGQFKTYSVLGGYENLATTTGIDGFYRTDFDFNVLKHSAPLVTLQSITDLNSTFLLVMDPRTSRFGPGLGGYQRLPGTAPLFNTNGNDLQFTARYFAPNLYFDFPSVTAAIPQKPAFEDSDHQARMPDAGIGFTTSSSSTAANPYGSLSDMTRRPVILQRPYTTVGELGYVFRDVPWQTINFFKDNAGDAALLDLFSVSDQPRVTSGYTDLNTFQPMVRNAILSKAGQLPDGTVPITNVTTLSSSVNSYISSGGLPTANLLANPSRLPAMLDTTLSAAGLSAIKNRREAVTRALSGGQSRTWNLLADTVCQSGKFVGGLNPSNFVVEGEKRSWLSFAIDRYEGRVIDWSVENVNE